MSVNDPLIGKQLGDYLIEGLLGTGGMARVYRGYDDNLDRYAAIKVIEPQLIASAEESEYRERFLREARAIARLSHPRIVGVYQFNQVSNMYYIAMEYVDGRNLRDILKGYIRQGKVMPTPEMLKVLRDIAEALDYAHKQGIIHRDVKPSNVIVTNDGNAILTDFGLALNAVEGTIGNTFGSVHYIAPEQAISSAQAVPQSDQYSLAIVAYELMTGRVPFDDASAMSVALKHISDPPPPPSEINPNIPPEVEQVVLRALDKDINKRYDSCVTFVRAIEVAFDMANVDELAAPQNLSASPKSSTPAPKPATHFDEREAQTILIPKQKAGTDSVPAVATDTVPPVARRSPLIWVGVVIVLALIVGGGLFFSGALDTGRAPTETAVALAMLQETSDAQASATMLAENLTAESLTQVVSASETAQALIPTATSTATSTDTPTNTATSTDTPTNTATYTATATVTSTDTPTHTATHTPTSTSTFTPTPTDTNTPRPTNTPIPALFITPESGEPQVLLRYDGRMIVISNRDPLVTLDVSDLQFVLFETREDGTIGESLRFDMGTQSFSNNARAMNPERCFQILDNTQFRALPTDNPLAQDSCGGRPFWLATANSFWISDDRDAYFEVRLGPVDLLATCPTNRSQTRAELRCVIDLTLP